MGNRANGGEEISTSQPAFATLEDKVFLLVLALVSIAFVLILWPFMGAVLWAVVLAILFKPVYRKILGWFRQRRTLASIATVVLIVILVLLPLAGTVASLVNEISQLYHRVQSGEHDVGVYFQRAFEALPRWAVDLLESVGLTDFSALQRRLSTGVAAATQFVVAHVINFGQNTFSFIISTFVMLYLLFFLFRDGDYLLQRIKETIPLRREQKRALLERFFVVVRATVKGSVVIALLQGFLGGIIFWVLGIEAALLWGVLMALLSLLPAVGAAMVWLPAAIYLMLSGSVGKGIILLVYGILVISLVDNFVRPILVGKDTKIPDYVILISTLGGIAVFGVNGFVIGPLIAATFIAVWNISLETRKASAESPIITRR